MAKDRSQREDYATPLRRLLVVVLCLLLAALFLVWRIDSPRVERFRAQLIDAVVPNMDWAMVPVTGTVNLFRDFQSYQRLAEQNRELRSELRQMRAWKEAALQLEQENARLLDLNNVRLDPQLTYITGVVMADSGSPFRQSVILNVGARDGIQDGWATMDGIGLVGRISGTGRNTARVVLLTDAASAVPVTIQPSGQTALVTGDNSAAPLMAFLENADLVRPGDRVITSGDGDVFPAGLLVGQVTQDRSGRMRVRLSADYERLEYLRVLRHHGTQVIRDPGGLIVPAPGATTPRARPGDLAPNAAPGEASDSQDSSDGAGNG
ncbi:Rod shape-determining protein MreC [Phaeobacter sp. CECT 5382]|uniref:rod shape-determining protein MreC n=1 Tax=Phaeobacter sp. CECT 5382 TaxID=1712645 RepID=UPI0006D9E5BA|nr:rod shape-determining protein MreC [Phaeobacter sp. CECT 5382]CUH88818.1 Rod shape-determining protein MreC [Phaeobacter sp. CECT 5382]